MSAASSAPAINITAPKKPKRLSKKDARAYHELQQSVHAAVHDLIHIQLPTQILALHRLLQSIPHIYVSNTVISTVKGNGSISDIATNQYAVKSQSSSYVWQPRQQKSALLIYQSDNMLIMGTHRQFKPILVALFSLLKSVQLSVKLTMPELGETSSHGEIPDEASASMSTLIRYLQPLLNSSILYHSHRATLLSKALKYPTNEDYQRAVSEWDEREWSRLVNGIRETLSKMIIARDLLAKNEEKLIEARTQHELAMY